MRNIISKIGEHAGALPMSWSRINLLLTCPRSFDLKYRKRLKEQDEPEDPSAAEAGSLMHKTLEYAVERCMRAKEFAYDKACYEVLFSVMLEQATYPGTRQRMLSLREPAGRVLARLLGMAAKFGADVLTEHRFAMDRNWEVMTRFPCREIAWQGYADLTMIAGGKGIIVDYKSEPYTEERSEKTELQTMLYAYALLRGFPEVQKVQTVTAFLQDERFVTAGSYARLALPALEERLKSLFTDYLEALESGDAEPRTSGLCQWCAFSRGCPKENAWRQEKSRGTSECPKACESSGGT